MRELRYNRINVRSNSKVLSVLHQEHEFDFGLSLKENLGHFQKGTSQEKKNDLQFNLRKALISMTIFLIFPKAGRYLILNQIYILKRVYIQLYIISDKEKSRFICPPNYSNLSMD